MPPKKKGKLSEAKQAELEQQRAAAEAAKLLEFKKQEEEHKKLWIESWNKKLKDEQRKETCQACCWPDEFYAKPKAQSNVWIQVNHEKNVQHVHMAIKNSRVPKPSPPPLPRLKRPETPPKEEKTAEKGKKKGKKGKN